MQNNTVQETCQHDCTDNIVVQNGLKCTDFPFQNILAIVYSLNSRDIDDHVVKPAASDFKNIMHASYKRAWRYI